MLCCVIGGVALGVLLRCLAHVPGVGPLLARRQAALTDPSDWRPAG